MKHPDFFIIGAPRCGTTAMAKYLSEHHSIFMPTLKEPKYYCKDLGHRVVKTKAEYECLFEAAGEQHLAVGEASTSYAYSRVAVPELLREHPGARLIFMLRDPVKAAASLHAHLHSLGIESVDDLSRAWDLQQERKKCRHIPRECNDAKRLLYGEIYLYGEQVQRIRQLLSMERLLLLFHEDLIDDPRSVYLEVLRFLDVPDDGREVFDRVHGLQKVRFSSMARAMRQARTLARKMGLPTGLGVGSHIAKLNRRPAAKKPMAPEVDEKLRQHFDLDIEKLMAFTGRDLRSWRIQSKAGARP